MLYLSSLIFVEINDMHFKKLFTTDINNPYKNIEFVNSSSEINNPDGTIVFSLKNIDNDNPKSPRINDRVLRILDLL